jgi:aspartate aminotransferase-like enzyme
VTAHEPIRFFLPGPVYVLEAVRAEMTRPVVAHRSAEFRAVWQTISSILPAVFRTARPCFTATGSSTLLMEASLASLTRSGGSVLHLTNGAFSERWLAVGRSIRRCADQIAMPWGEAVDPDLVRAALGRKHYEAVTVVHNETSTGVVSPVAEIAALVREASDALLLVDAVSSLGGAPVETDAWGLDLVFAGVQKGIAAPPGLTVFTFSERAERRARSIPHRGFYGDLLRYRDQQAAGGPITTPAIAECFALARQLERIRAEGIESRWARHDRLARATEEFADRAGLAYPARPAARSRTVACLRPPSGRPAPELVRGLARRGYTVAGGYGEWKATTLRIGHMGEVGDEDLAALFAALAEELAA